MMFTGHMLHNFDDISLKRGYKPLVYEVLFKLMGLAVSPSKVLALDRVLKQGG